MIVSITAMRNLRGLWFLVLVCFLSGCTTMSYKPAAFPKDKRSHNDGVARHWVRLGSNVRVIHMNGEKISGLVAQLTDTEVVVRQKGSDGSLDRTIAFEDIASVEEGKPLQTDMAVVGVIGALGVVIGVMALISDAHDGEEW